MGNNSQINNAENKNQWIIDILEECIDALDYQDNDTDCLRCSGKLSTLVAMMKQADTSENKSESELLESALLTISNFCESRQCSDCRFGPSVDTCRLNTTTPTRYRYL